VADLMLRQLLRNLLRLINPTPSIVLFNLLDEDSRASAINRIVNLDLTELFDVFHSSPISALIIRRFLEHIRVVNTDSTLAPLTVHYTSLDDTSRDNYLHKIMDEINSVNEMLQERSYREKPKPG